MSHLKYQHAQRPPIYVPIVALALDDLRRQVSSRPAESVGHLVLI
jgi:hypothetical protein